MVDYVIVGAGLFGAVFAYEAKKRGKTCIVLDKRGHIGGNIYTENINGIEVHQYGAHIFHTSDLKIWDYIQQFATFNRFTNSPVANYKGCIFSLPFNMYTFHQMWGVVTPEQAMSKIKEQVESAHIVNPQNLEEQAISLVGEDIYQALVKGYTEKQWGRRCNQLPAFIIRRLPVRFTYDNNYFDDSRQGIPIGGYTRIVTKMLDGIEVRLDTDFFDSKAEWMQSAKKVLFTGMIDAYFQYRLGELEYRSLRFDTQILAQENFQGNAVVNYTDAETPYTRIIEHKFFEFGKQPCTVVTKEYPADWHRGDEPYYPVNDEKNNKLFNEYKKIAKLEPNVIFGGRLAQYTYYDMDDVIRETLNMVEAELHD